MQCQSSQHCPKWHNCHTAGSDKIPLLSTTTCIAPTCTAHAAHIQMNQVPAVPAMSAVQKNAPAPMPATYHATPVQLCLHGTKTSDPGNLGTIDPDCPWTLLL